MTEALKQAIRRYADRHANADGLAETPVPGLGMMCRGSPSGEIRAIYKPVLCLVLQGAKQVMAGETLYGFAAGQSVIVSADLPVIGRIVEASRALPYLAVSLDLDLPALRDLASEIAAIHPVPADGESGPVLIAETDEAILDCMTRLVRLIDHPEAIPLLHGPIIRELYYWLLRGRHGAALGRLALPDGSAQRIARAVALLRAGFAQTLPVERLAAAAGMSPSSFHQHFKAVTSLSPLQFQKQLRLLEARRLMLAEGSGATAAAFAVGYESVSQFTREYGRMFGAPPARDIGASRAAA